MPEERNGILLVSFGTSYEETRIKTLDRIEKDVADNYSGYRIYTAWTCRVIIDKVKARDGYHIDTVKEAMEKILRDGIEKLVIQPTYVISGIENDRMREEVMTYQDRIPSIALGMPLLGSEEDSERVLEILRKELPPPESDTAVVWMGHGTAHDANAVYKALDDKWKDHGYPNVYVGTVEAYPSLETLRHLLQNGNYRKIILTPFMMVAGDHAEHDMASDEEHSWKYQFEKLGYEVSCIVKGLGEYEGIRALLMNHLECAAEK